MAGLEKLIPESLTLKERKDYSDAIIRLFDSSKGIQSISGTLFENYRESILALSPEQKEEIADYIFARSAQLFLQHYSRRGCSI